MFRTHASTRPIEGASDLTRAKRELRLEIRTRGAVCLSRFTMEHEYTLELVRRAAESLVAQGLIRRVPDLGETFERV